MTDLPIAAHSYRDLVVQLTGSGEDAFRLGGAQHLAEMFGAHIIGVHLHTLPDILEITDPAHSGMIRTLLEESESAADKAYAGLAATFGAMNVSHELRRLHGGAAGVGSDLAEIARCADLFIGTRPYGDPTAHTKIEERVLFGSGRGCLLLPPGGNPHPLGETITVAWDGSREAARTVAEAMPLLVRAATVHLVAVCSTMDETDRHAHVDAIAAHLGRFGIAAEISTLPYTTGTGEQIEEFAHQKGSGLIVMGAYGHARAVEWIFRGATRYILRHSTLPVLMAH